MSRGGRITWVILLDLPRSLLGSRLLCPLARDVALARACTGLPHLGSKKVLMAVLSVLKAGRRRVGWASKGISLPIATSCGLVRGAQACCNFTFAQLKLVRDQTCRYRLDLPLVCFIDHLYVLHVLLAARKVGIPGLVLVLAVLLALEGKLRLHSSCRVAYVRQSA